tara:strand:+ start:19 stop:891 length:873 start_codon:yes stop_codon:yes gene_type:complete
MLHTDATTIDFGKHKRLFVIGCSFTHWIWPTWADIIQKQHPHLEYYNFGVPGCGNDYMLTIINQITREYTLDENDLVIIMWSSFHRLSYYNTYRSKDELQKALISGTGLVKEDIIKCTYNWESGDDIIGLQALNNTHASCDRGYLIRDLAIIDTVTALIEQSRYSGAYMLSTGIKDQHLFDSTAVKTYSDDVFEFYKHIDSKCLGDSLYTVLGPTHNVIKWDPPGPEEDYHPYSVQYCDYLKALNFEISDEIVEWCNECDQVIAGTTDAVYLDQGTDWPYSFRGTTKFPL